MKIAVFITSVLALLIFAGVYGWLFQIWPTSWPDSDLKISAAQVEQLKQLRSEVKFHKDPKTFYPGAINEASRVGLETVVNASIDLIIPAIQRNPKKSSILVIFKVVLSNLNLLDSEDKDQLIIYFGRILKIAGVQSSNELFNVWRYGFPYGLLN
jgi:hypothetical protein